MKIMMTIKKLLFVVLLTSTTFAAPAAAANLHIDIVHRTGPREPPPPVREDRYEPRRGYLWIGGHYEWRHGRYVWRRGHYSRERRGYDWEDGRWDPHR
jgi:hypothetical protein